MKSEGERWREKILKEAGLTEEDLDRILNKRIEDLSPEYRELYESLPKTLRPDIAESIRRALESRKFI